MKIEYSINLIHDECFLEKVRLHVNGLREFDVKSVYVIDNTSLDYFDEVMNSTTGKCVIVVVNSGSVITVEWIKDKKIHREDGPAFERYYYDEGELRLIQAVTGYYYNGRDCMNTSFDLEEVMQNYERNGDIILGAEKINDNIFYIKVLLKDSIKEHWYWIENKK